MGSVGKKGGKVEVSEYTMSIHMGICAYGEGLQLIALRYGDKQFFRGALTDQQAVGVNDTELFGGIKKEGGAKGVFWWLPGKATQILPQVLASKFGLASNDCPGFRGLASVFFTGGRGVDASSGLSADMLNALRSDPANNRDGFYWAANNPYLRKLSARVRRPSIGLNPAYAMIRMPNDSQGNAQYASNPAHIIYECFTDTDWGMGESPAVINKDRFEQCAYTLYRESFGLAMMWTRQTTIDKFVGEVLNHVQGAVFVEPATGQHTMKLLRADYDYDSLPVIHPGNAILKAFRRKVWGEISNEVSVTYTNQETGKDATVVAHDLAGIAAQGGIISSGKNYYGVPSEPLAIMLAERDLAASVNPVATCEAVVTREFWNTVSSNVVRLHWPEYNIESIVFRVSEVTKDANTVELSLYEDIFGLDRANYLSPRETEWVNPSRPPSPASYYQVGTAPAFLMSAALGLNDPSELDYPEVMSSVTIGADSDDDVSYDLVSYVTDVNGTTTRASLGTRAFKGTWSILNGLVAEPVTLLASLPGLRGAEPVAGNFIMIGTGADEFTEIATVQQATGQGYFLNRGMLDTVPRAWPAGTRAFVIPASTDIADPTLRSAFEDTSYWFLTRTTAGSLKIEDAPQVNVALSERPYLPNRPANVKVNGVAFGPVAVAADTPVVVTWANRNRIMESTQAPKWTDGNVTGEVGQTTRVIVTKPDGKSLLSYGGLAGADLTIPRSAFGSFKSATLTVFAERDGLRSLQGASFPLVIA